MFAQHVEQLGMEETGTKKSNKRMLKLKNTLQNITTA